MNALWISGDRAELRKIMGAWELMGHTTSHPRRRFNPPSHTSEGDPAVFTAWTIGGYPLVERGYFDSASGPGREGILRVLFWLQPGRGGSVLDGEDGLYQQLLNHLEEAETYLQFFPPYPVGDSERPDQDGAVWHVEGIEIPFKVA